MYGFFLASPGCFQPGYLNFGLSPRTSHERIEGMKRIRVKAFGITREILGRREIILELKDGQTVADLRARIASEHPRVQALKSLFVAVNNEYAEDALVLQEEDEVALIPPVSGG